MNTDARGGRPKSVCLVRLSALGDVVLALPLVRWLQQQLPGARLTWITGSAVMPVLAGLETEGVELVSIEKPRGPSDYFRLRRQFAGRSFDALLCLQASWRANLLYPMLSATRKIGYGGDRAKDCHTWFVRETLPEAPPHLVDGFLQFAAALGLPVPGPDELRWQLPIAPDAAAWAARELPREPFIAISACASKPERDWPPERLAEVLCAIHKHHRMPVVLLGGRASRERTVADRLTTLSGISPIDLVGRTSLPQLVAALGRARLLIAPDTGAVHIARALDRPVVGLYAVAPASRTGPYGASVHCVDVFAEAVRSLQGRDPDSVPWSHRVHDPRAMELISTTAVLSKIDSILNSPPSTP